MQSHYLSIEGDRMLQLAIAFYIEYSNGKNGSLDQWLNQIIINHAEETDHFHDSFVALLITHPKIERLVLWHTQNQNQMTKRSLVMMDLIIFLMQSPKNTLNKFLSKLKPNIKDDYYKNIEEVESLIKHPFFGFNDLHKANNVLFEADEHNRLYWANAMIYRLRLNKDFNPIIVLYSAYLDILASAISSQTLSIQDNRMNLPLALNAYDKPQAESLHLIQHHIHNPEPKSNSSKLSLLKLLNEKRYQFGMSYFTNEAIEAINDHIHTRPTFSNTLFDNTENNEIKPNITFRSAL